MKDTVSASGENDEAEKKSAGGTKESRDEPFGAKRSRASPPWGDFETIVEESEDEDDTDGSEFVDAWDDASWLPGRNKVSREDVWKLTGEFADTLRRGDHFHAETALWENTAEALSGLDRGQIAPVDAMRVVGQVIGSIRQRLNAEEAAKAPSTILPDLEIVVENMIKDFGPAALRSFLTSIAAQMGPYVCGLVSAGMTVPGVCRILRSNANLRNKFFSAFKLAVSSLFTGSFAHAAALGYLRGFTSDRFEELLGEIDSYGDPQPFLDPDQKVSADSSDQESPAGGSEPPSPSSPGTYLLNKASSGLVIAPCGEEACEYMAFLPALPAGEKEARYIDLGESQLFFRFQQEDPQNGVLALEGFPDKDSKTPSAYLQVEGDEAAITHMAKVLRGQLPTVMSIYGGEGDLSIELIGPFAQAACSGQSRRSFGGGCVFWLWHWCPA